MLCPGSGQPCAPTTFPGTNLLDKSKGTCPQCHETVEIVWNGSRNNYRTKAHDKPPYGKCAECDAKLYISRGGMDYLCPACRAES